jgi:hypothetical protein
VLELEVVTLKSIFAWMTVYNSPHFPKYMEFLDLFSSFFLPNWEVSLVCFMCTWVAPL